MRAFLLTGSGFSAGHTTSATSSSTTAGLSHAVRRPGRQPAFSHNMGLTRFRVAMHSATAMQGRRFKAVPCSVVGAWSRTLFLGEGLRPVSLGRFLSAEIAL